MTDEELERLSNAVIRLDGGTYGHAGATKLGRGVLALLERVRKAEDQLATIAATVDYEGLTDGLADAVKRFYVTGMDVCAKAISERKAAEARVERLRFAGAGLANLAHNLKQLKAIPEEHRRSLDEGQRAWDVVLAGGATPTTRPARRPSPSTDPVNVARREALVSALRLAEDVEREEGEQGRMGPASGAGEVKDRIKDRIRWLDEGTE